MEVAVFTRKELATLEQQIEILDWYHKTAKIIVDGSALRTIVPKSSNQTTISFDMGERRTYVARKMGTGKL
jgi:hypothetical protein